MRSASPERVVHGPTWQTDDVGEWLLPELTLGWQVLGWTAEWLTQPDGPDAGQPWQFTPEQARFVLWWYAVDERGRWLYRTGTLRRMKGWGKDPVGAVLAAVEFAGPCRVGGWHDGQPVGVPHPAPWVQTVAVSKDQTRNTMRLFPGLFSKQFLAEYDVDLGKEIIYGRGGRAVIEAVTSSPKALEGGRTTFTLKNETQWWLANNDGHAMDDTIAGNLAKSRDGSARALEICNAHVPGQDSVGERSWEAWEKVVDGRSKARGILYDSLEAPADIDLSDRDQLEAGIVAARGDSHWLDVERLVEDVYDPRTSPSSSRRKYLNQTDAADDAWLAEWEVKAAADAGEVVADREQITLGFDGSRKRSRGVTDATALIGCRLSDGHLFTIGCWEQPDGPAGDDWQVPKLQVEATVRDVFDRWDVVGFYADPAKWETYIASWEATWGDRLQVQASRNHPCEWWMTGGRALQIVRATERLHTALTEREITYDGSGPLTRHLMNARRRVGKAGVQIAKENPESPRKIDAAVAAVLAFEARHDALAKGVHLQDREPARSKRVYRF